MPVANITKEGIVVRTGQTWKDLDKRMAGRSCRVQAVEDGKAVLQTGGGRRTRVSISRMHRHSTGWKMVRDEVGNIVP